MDTLTINHSLVNQLQHNADYDYNREIVHEDTNILESLRRAVSRLIDSVFGSNFYTEHEVAIWLTITIIGLSLLAYLIYRSHPAFLSRDSRTVNTDDPASEDNIYGVDFVGNIRRAWADGDYRQVVRLVYLQTLRALADHHLIDWRLSKTPTQYTREYRSRTFALMTSHFLRVRYGDFPADGALADTMLQLQREVLHDAGLDRDSQQEGGER